MNDLISRQAAIDAIMNTEPVFDSQALEPYQKTKDVIRALESLPSAQPEQRWIPCEKRLPEDDAKVLCCTETKKRTKNIVIGYHYESRWACGMNSNVVAWMPLPEPYQERRTE